MASYICPDCGYVHDGEPPTEDCPICGAPAEDFEKSEQCDIFATLLLKIEKNDMFEHLKNRFPIRVIVKKRRPRGNLSTSVPIAGILCLKNRFPIR